MKRILAALNRIMIGVMIGIMLVVILLTFIVIGLTLYVGLTEKEPYCRQLLADKPKLEFREGDIQALLREVEELIQDQEEDWDLRRVLVRQRINSNDTMDYSSIYLYYKPKDETESFYRRIRLYNENDGWYIVEAYELDEREEYVYMEGNISITMLMEILESAEEQAALYCSEADDYNISVTSEEVSIEAYQAVETDGEMEFRTIKRLEFQVKETEAGYQLDSVTVHSY
ncbi:MAG: hypothetical protein K2K74_14710 [Lachnospiraceae bacterium]|nr:hypothetical protein [Lachnospiraceae bacterium]